MKYKLIVSDIDGTLISTSGEISSKTKELVRSYQQKGGKFSIATGRMLDAILPFIEELELDTPVIIYNGSEIVDVKNDKTIFELKLDYKVAIEALEACSDYNLDPILYLDKTAYISKMTPAIEKHVDKEKVGCVEVGNLTKFLKVNPTKILFIGDPKDFDGFTKYLEDKIATKLNIICSESNYLEILPVNASKGDALRRLSDYLQIPIEDTIAIGDERNDVSMIRVAGIGVAVKNARSELIKDADYITEEECFKGVEEILNKVINDIEIY